MKREGNMLKVRRWLALTAATLLSGAPGFATSTDLAATRDQQRLDLAVDEGLAFLARVQTRDGAIGNTNTPAITSLAVMAFLTKGYAPGLPPYGNVINRGIDFILSSANSEGLIYGQKGEMYNHNISTLMLSEVSGMVDPDRQTRIDRILPRAIRIILAAQQAPKKPGADGGWRYKPASDDSDISHVGWALAALRSARNNGAPVPRETIDRAIAYVMRCRGPDAGFTYMPDSNNPNMARTGIALLCLELAGHHRDEVTLQCGQYILSQFQKNPEGKGEKCFYYSMYYIGNSMFQLGGREWDTLAPRLYNTLLNYQTNDGSWSPHGTKTKDPAYCTSMAILTLGISYRQLPIYQR